MRWVLNNLQLIFVVAGVIAYWLVQTRRQKEIQREAEEELGRPPTGEEMAERTRRIQEEIRRTIAERQGGRPPTEEEVEDETVFPSPPVVRRQPPLPPPQPLPPVVETAMPGAEELQRALDEQRWIAAELERPESESQVAMATVAPVTTQEAFLIAAPASVAAGLRRTRLLADLSDHAALRRAVLLREILGPAKGW